MNIPLKYYMGNLRHPIARNVAELKAHLQDLPDDLPIEIGFSDAAQLVVYNHSKPDIHLTFEEVD